MTQTTAELPPLRDVIARYDLRAKKSLGQHFLLDQNLTDRIVRTAGDLSQFEVIEVGPGPGGLTRALLASNAQRVTVIEKDARCIEALRELSLHYPGRLNIVEGDALESGVLPAAEMPRQIIANLPYNISTVLLIGWLRNIAAYDSLTLMFQKEVADRIVSPPGTKAYGRLSVMSQWLCDVQSEFTVDRRAFTPPPNVTSSVVSFISRKLDVTDRQWSAMEQVAKTLFGQRRKMLRSTMKQLGLRAETIGLDPQSRAENLSVEQFYQIAEALIKET